MVWLIIKAATANTNRERASMLHKLSVFVCVGGYGCAAYVCSLVRKLRQCWMTNYTILFVRSSIHSFIYSFSHVPKLIAMSLCLCCWFFKCDTTCCCCCCYCYSNRYFLGRARAWIKSRDLWRLAYISRCNVNDFFPFLCMVSAIRICRKFRSFSSSTWMSFIWLCAPRIIVVIVVVTDIAIRCVYSGHWDVFPLHAFESFKYLFVYSFLLSLSVPRVKV